MEVGIPEPKSSLFAHVLYAMTAATGLFRQRRIPTHISSRERAKRIIQRSRVHADSTLTSAHGSNSRRASTGTSLAIADRAVAPRCHAHQRGYRRFPRHRQRSHDGRACRWQQQPPIGACRRTGRLVGCPCSGDCSRQRFVSPAGARSVQRLLWPLLWPRVSRLRCEAVLLAG